MELKQRCIVLYSCPYRVKDDKTGEVNEGISIRYLPTENLNPCSKVMPNGVANGMKVGKASLPIEKGVNLQKVPAFYDVVMTAEADSDGKMVLKPRDVEFVSLINIVPATSK